MENKPKKHPLSVVALRNKRTTGLLIVAFLLFNYPLLSFASHPVMVSGIPLLFLYLFVIWFVIIMLSVLINRITRDDISQTSHESEAE